MHHFCSSTSLCSIATWHKVQHNPCMYQEYHVSLCMSQEPEPMPPGKGRRNVEATPGPPDSVSTQR